MCADRDGTSVNWSTCRLQPAELCSSSWPARGSDRSAGWGSVKSSVSAGYFLWPLTTPPDLPPDSHLDGKVREGQQKKTDRDRAEEVIVLSFKTALLPVITHNKMFLRCLQRYMQEAARLCIVRADSSCLVYTEHLDANNFTFSFHINL